MDNQHKKITGYRDLTADEIDAMNGVKELEKRFNGMTDYLGTLADVDQRQLAIARTAGEEAFMRAVRSVARPERIVEPYVKGAK